MTEPQGRILVVDDDSALRRVLGTTLRAFGFAAKSEPSGEDALEILRREEFDVVLLDINMPGMGGIAACRAIRQLVPSLNILMLTVQDQQEKKVEALDAGADDYITKPFEAKELAARIRSAVRRSHALQRAGELKTIIRVGDLELHTEKRRLLKSGKQVRLTPKEFEILHYLMSHLGYPVTHTTLLRAVWGAEYGAEVEYLRTFMRQLRKKIGDVAAEPIYIQTEPYVGYRFLEGPDQAV